MEFNGRFSFACWPLMRRSMLRTGQGHPDLSSLLDVSEVSRLALDRWILPRSKRRTEYRSWTRENLLELLGNHSRSIKGRLTMSSGRA